MASTAPLLSLSALLLLLLLALHRLHPLPRPAPTTPLLRQTHNLLYWKPHKTASTSARFFLQALAARANLSYVFTPSSHYRFLPPAGLAARAAGRNCSVLVGHARAPPVTARAHEAGAGAVLTTTRAPRAYLVSRYFYAAETTFTRAHGRLRDPGSAKSRLWWTRWETYDVCEAFRYYDGARGCDERAGALRARAGAIAGRVDCAIDAEDAQADAEAVCRAVGVRECPRFGARNVKEKPGGGYEGLLEVRHVRVSLRRAERALGFLREALMERRCRFLKGGRGTMGDLPPAPWPVAGQCTP